MRTRRVKRGRRKKFKKRKHTYPASEAPWRLPLISGMLQKSNPHDTRRFEFAIFTELPTNKSRKDTVHRVSLSWCPWAQKLSWDVSLPLHSSSIPSNIWNEWLDGWRGQQNSLKGPSGSIYSTTYCGCCSTAVIPTKLTLWRLKFIYIIYNNPVHTAL